MRYIPAMGQRSASFVCTQSDQNNYTNDLWTHYLIFFIRLSGSFELHWLLTWLLLQWALFEEKKKGSKVIRQHISARLHPPQIASHSYILIEIVPRCQQELLSHLFYCGALQMEEGSAAFWGKRKVVSSEYRLSLPGEQEGTKWEKTGTSPPGL